MSNSARCTSTGRRCDGYTELAIGLSAQRFSFGELKPAWPCRALATLPDLGNDIQYLDFYYHCVGPKLSGRFDTVFWSHTILQMAHAESGVRSALIALGHLSQRQSGSLQHARRAAVARNLIERRPFWVNYNKAIRYLIDHMSKPTFSAEVGLVICLLFACIEFLQADASVAFTHIRSGLNIVHEVRQHQKMGLTCATIKIHDSCGDMPSNVIERTLVPILTQALASALPYGASIERDFDFLMSCPTYFKDTSFSSLLDARLSFFDLRNAAILLARDMAVKLYQAIPFTSLDHRRQTDVLVRHGVWLQAFTTLESSCQWGQDDIYAINALKIGYIPPAPA